MKVEMLYISDIIDVEMIHMLHNESRDPLVLTFEKNHNARQTAQDFSVSLGIIYLQHSGSVDFRINQRGRKAKLTQRDIDTIRPCLKISDMHNGGKF